MGRTFVTTGDSVILDFKLVWESETDYDFTTVEIDTAGSEVDIVTAAAFDGQGAGGQSLVLRPGIETRSDGGPIQVRFCFGSDGAWSDEDGLSATACGAFSVDDIAFGGGVTQPPEDFEGGDGGGWVRLPSGPGPGGDWSDIVHLDDLPPSLSQCGCGLWDSVLVFVDLDAGGHNAHQDNLAASPWIDLKAQGVAGGYGKLVQYRLDAYLPLLNYLFMQENAQWYPEICRQTGDSLVSGWTSPGFFYGVPSCSHSRPVVTDWSPFIPPGAERVRIAFGVHSYCLFFANCNGQTNTTPWFDDIRFGVYGVPGAPFIQVPFWGTPQDAFPLSGTLGVSAPGRIDCNNIVTDSSPEIGSLVGDTLIVHGAEGGAEVHVQFAVAPGPGIDVNKLNTLYGKTTFQEARRGLDWYSARMDTAELGASGAVQGTWMTAFHELDRGFSGTDTDKDPYDPTPAGRHSRLGNDIFPDNLLTPGSRLFLFYKTRFLGSSVWFTLPDTAGGNYLEMEVLPSSMEGDGTFNCVLYVDHFGRGGQETVETALAAVLPNGSTNWENTGWDRYDVENPSSQQGSFGRPLDTEFGATLTQALGYKTILWNSGNLNSFNLAKEDADILIPWLTMPEIGGNNLYLTGDGIANSMSAESASEPSAYRLLADVCGVTRLCNTFRDQGCPAPSAPQDATVCVQIDPATGARTASRPLGGVPVGQGNGCPQQRSFDVIRTNPAASYGSPTGEEIYTGDVKAAAFASVSNHSDVPGGARFKTVVDGLSVQIRRDPAECVSSPTIPPQAVEERLREVLGWFGYTGDAGGCRDATRMTTVPTEPVRFRTALASVPNPMTLGSEARIRFSLADPGPATLAVFDLQGRLVKTLFDGGGAEGWNEAAWDGTDGGARPVASGVYFYRLRTRETVIADKMVVLRGGG
jgi:hypothetical protein